MGDICDVWELPEVAKVLRGQKKGRLLGEIWRYPPHHKPMVETFKRFRLLISRYKLDRKHPQVESGSEFLFITQTPEVDFRGMIGDQYATYYTGEFTAFL